MTITIPTSYTITAAGALALPLADAAPVSTAMLNSNAAYSLHRPPLRSTVYTDDAASSGAREYRLAILPSADGLVYRFRHIVRTGTGATATTITVEWQSGGGGFTSIYSAATATGASAVHDISHTATIPASADVLRITYDRGADDYMADSVLIIPEPAAPTARTAAGLWPYDDGLLAATGAPINTELVCRPWRNLAAVVGDRAQNVMSFTQRGDTSAQYTLTGTGYSNGAWVLMGKGVAQVPYAPATIALTATAIGASAVSGANRVRIVAGGVSAILDCAASALDSATISSVPVIMPGTLQAMVEVSIYGAAQSADALYLYDAALHYEPTASSALPVAAVDPPATVALLAAVVRETERRCMKPWAQPALCFDGVTTGSESRRYLVSVPPGCQRARLAIVRADLGQGTLQASSTIETTTTSGVPASPAAAIVTAPTMARGTLLYLDTGGGGAAPVIEWSSASYDVDGTPPVATTDRQIELAEARAPGIETVQVGYACGAALHLVRVRPAADYAEIP